MDRAAPATDGDAACAALTTHYRPLAEREANRKPDRIVPVASSSALPSDASRIAADGSLVFTFGGSDGALRILDTAGGRFTELAQVPLPEPALRLLVVPGHRVVVFGGSTDYLPSGDRAETTVLRILDVSDPRSPRTIRSERIDGEVLGAAMQEGKVRVVLASRAHFLTGPTSRDETDAQVIARNLAAARAMQGADYLPHRQIRDADDHVVADGTLVECADVAQPSAPNGLGLTSVLTFDPTSTDPARAHAVADLATLSYDGGERIYLASFDGRAPKARSQGATTVHAFDGTSQEEAPYVASGAVPGIVPGDEAFSARDGVLRVALGVSYLHGPPNGRAADRRGLAVLREDGANLRLLGSVTAAGKGDWIQDLAWVGDVVLIQRPNGIRYVLDARDPSRPKLASELQLPGKVGFVQEIDSDRALTVGPRGDSNRTRSTLGILDVSRPETPTLVTSTEVGAGHSDVGGTPEGFGWLPELHLAVVPVTTSESVGPPQCPLSKTAQPTCSRDVADAVLVTVTESGQLRPLGRVSIGGHARRFLALGDLVLGLTDETVVLIDPQHAKVLDTLKGEHQKG